MKAILEETPVLGRVLIPAVIPAAVVGSLLAPVGEVIAAVLA
jgi:hypothetical protein